MQNLNFDAGVKTYLVNGSYELRYNPADIGFIEKFFQMVDNIEKLREANDISREEAGDDGAKLFSFARKIDRDIRDQIDMVFGTGTSDGIFPCNVTALADGLPIWLNFVLCVIDDMDAEIVNSEAKGSPRMQKYMDKYKKYQRK